MDTIYCDYRGLWSQAPVCDKLCGDLPSVRNGSVSASGLLTPGTTVIVFCDDGFEPLRNFFTCATNGSWIGNPACVRRSCPVSALLGVANATRPEVTGSLTVGSVLTYICSGGFSPAPNSSMKITCNEMGEWTGNPACFINPPCTNVVTTTKGVLWRLCDGYAPGIGHPSKGRIEVNFDGTWGTVCDDGDFLDVDGNIESFPWSVESLNVACRTFGFSKSTGVNRRRAYFGEGVGPILLDDVICTGSETLFTDCSHSRDHIATGECSHSEDQGIECI
ncbi:antigen WC1.1-like [Dreissena polymorpha]|uniref:antigen WC1.1-like n=1 Tax=Dreissena polymorpha TaxID=45954 RepID=UPI002264573E|nr:antigen WC1.1-like [Dreissena polymorpha]